MQVANAYMALVPDALSHLYSRSTRQLHLLTGQIIALVLEADFQLSAILINFAGII
jgi:hypothetical protein